MPLHHRHLDANEESSLLLRAELPLQPTFPTENQPTDNCCRSSWVAYNKVLDNHPLPVKSITAMILLSSGDLVAQTIEHLRGTAVYSGVDMPRVCRFGAFGLFGAPWSHYYFQNLDHYLPASEKPWSSTTATKVSIDQFIQAPILLAIMIVMLDIMKGEDFTEVRADLAKSFRSTLIANCKQNRSAVRQLKSAFTR
jgi:hypothetical protein